MRAPSAVLEHRNGKWQVSVRRGAGHATEGQWLVLGASPSAVPAIRLWLGVIGQERH